MTISPKFTYSYPTTVPPKSDLYRTQERKQELVFAACRIIGEDHILAEVGLNFGNGSVTLVVESADNPDFSGSCIIDAVATKFFQEKKENIRAVNPGFIAKLEDLTDTSDLEKITDIFYFAFNNYLQENSSNERVTNSTIAEIKSGLKNPKICQGEVINTKQWQLNNIPEFKEFIQSLPTSLVDVRESKKISPFLQKALDQKQSLQDKMLYLRQVIGFLLLQDILKSILEDTKVSIAIEKQQMYSSTSRDPDLSQQSIHYAYRSERICDTLAKLPINSVLTLIPLACRSNPANLSIFDLLNRHPEEQHPFVLESRYLAQECNNAREADIAIRGVFEDSFKSPPEKFFHNESCIDSDGAESFLMGMSGLAISPGLYGRLPMDDHKNIYYKRHPILNTDSVSDNIPCEFLMTAAQFLFEKEYNWLESSCFAYLQQMMGNPSIYELDAIKAKLQRIRDVVEKLPVGNVLKAGSACNSHILRNSGIKKLSALYQQGREMSGLEHPSRNRDLSSCSIS